LDGCYAPSSGYNYVFKNNSSYSLHITPAGQGWSAFDVPPAQRHVLIIQDAVVYFNFDQTALVLCDTSTPGTIVFTNGIAAMLQVIGTPGNAAASAYITYTVGLSTVQVNNGNLVALPWSYSLAGYSGENFQLTVIQNPSLGYATASLYENGILFQTSSTSAGNDQAVVAGTF
jgi:hypothetical protein